MTIAVRGHIDNKADVEMGPSIQYRLGIFGNFFVEHIIAFIVFGRDGIKGTNANTAAAADAEIIFNPGLAILNPIRNSSKGADLATHLAAAAFLFLYKGFTVGMHFHLAPARTTAHTDVFQDAAEAGIFVAFKMSHRDKDIGIHNRPTDFS